MPPMVSMINLGLRCFWEMQPRSVNSSCWQKKMGLSMEKVQKFIIYFFCKSLCSSWYSLQVDYSKGQWCSGSE